MPQLNDFQQEVIVLFTGKSEHPTWGYKKCCAILPEFFGCITQYQFDGVVAKLKQEGEDLRCSCAAEFVITQIQVLEASLLLDEFEQVLLHFVVTEPR